MQNQKIINNGLVQFHQREQMCFREVDRIFSTESLKKTEIQLAVAMIMIYDNAWWWTVIMLITSGTVSTTASTSTSATPSLSSTTTTSTSSSQGRPHIILIVADDLGWNDVSWHNKAVLMPNLEHLARSGVILNSSYVQPICTPTRSALLTGRYPFTLGRQHDVLWPMEPTGLTLNATLLPQSLKQLGYSTHIVGKWHLGFCSWAYTPTKRGFDTFYGHYTGAEDYYHHSRPRMTREYLQNDYHPRKQRGFPHKTPFGFDFRNNTETDLEANGIYSTYLFRSYVEDLFNRHDPNEPLFLYLPFQSVHTPLQVPKNYTKPFSRIRDKHRKIKMGMIYAMDEAVGHMMSALKASGHYNNSVIVFTTDNGGPTVSAGNNWPLRGNKTTLWEGGTRGAAFIHSPHLPNSGSISDKVVHVTDWHATLVLLAGGEPPEGTDGVDQWEALTSGAPSPRNTMIYNIDYRSDGLAAAVRMGDFKLIVGNPGPGEWTPPPEGLSHPKQPSKRHPKHLLLHSSYNLPQYQQQPDSQHPDAAGGNMSTKTQHNPSRLYNLTDNFPSNSNHNQTSQNTSIQFQDVTRMDDYAISETLDLIHYSLTTSQEYETSSQSTREADDDLFLSSFPNNPVGRNDFQDLPPREAKTKGNLNPYLLSRKVDQGPLVIQAPKRPNMKKQSGGTSSILQDETEGSDNLDFLIERDDDEETMKNHRHEDNQTIIPDLDLQINREEENEGERSSGNESNILHQNLSRTVDMNEAPNNQSEPFSDTLTAPTDDLTVRNESSVVKNLTLEFFLSNKTKIRLFNLKSDPEERVDLSGSKPDVVKVLLQVLLQELPRYVEADIVPNDPHANPKYWHNIWTPGWCKPK